MQGQYKVARSGNVAYVTVVNAAGSQTIVSVGDYIDRGIVPPLGRLPIYPETQVKTVIPPPS